MIIRWTRSNAPKHVARNFHLGEFECRCGVCEEQLIDSNLLELLDSLRDDVKGPIHIHSGFRCEARNIAVGGETKSRHLRGLAADISSSSCTMEELERLCEKYFQRMGIAKTFIHVDVDEGEAKWYYP